MKIKSILSKATLAAMLVSFLTPMAVFVPQASADADTCTWTGNGTPGVVPESKTVTFDIADADNWTGCDNATVPEDGDSLVFPANKAQVDASDTLTDDSEWKYVIDNTLPNGTSFAAITFSGATGSDCKYSSPTLNANNDTYYFTGNNITMNGDILSTYTGSCLYELPHFELELVFTVDATIDVHSNSIEYGSNELTICDEASANNNARSSNIWGLKGNGNVVVNCSVTLGASGTGTGRTINAASGVSLSMHSMTGVSSVSLANQANLSIYLSTSSPYPEMIISTNIVFAGGPKTISAGDGVWTYDHYTQTLKSTKYTQAGRLAVSYQSYDMASETNTPRNVKFTGNISFTNDLDVLHHANVDFAGSINGSGKVLSAREGSSGIFKISSTNNTSATSAGVGETKYVVYEIDGDYRWSDELSNLTAHGGYFYYLKTADSRAGNVAVSSFGKFGGLGKVGTLKVHPGGIYAPGLSPGCISTGNLTINGTYEIELAGPTACSEYDQTDVAGTVDLTGGTLEVTVLNNYVPKLNDAFTIIKNDGSDAVTGTFSGLVEGAKIEKAGVTYQISYKGGDGNDVVLTATVVPTAAATPKTGVGSVMNSPLGAVIMAASAAAILVVSRRLNKIKR